MLKKIFLVCLPINFFDLFYMINFQICWQWHAKTISWNNLKVFDVYFNLFYFGIWNDYDEH